MKNSKELKKLNLKPLSIAKFFYEKGVQDHALMQDLIYLTYLTVLVEENALLFPEKFKAWTSGPTIESVFLDMDKYLDEEGDLTSLFFQVKGVNDELTLSYLEKIWQEYERKKRQHQEFVFLFQVKDRPWQLARRNLTDDDLASPAIDLADLLAFARQRKSLEVFA
jgi:uncharacterized phage-associated protein